MSKVEYIFFVLLMYVLPAMVATAMSLPFEGASIWTTLLFRFEVFALAYFLIHEVIFMKSGALHEKSIKFLVMSLVAFWSTRSTMMWAWLLGSFIAFSLPVSWATQAAIISVSITTERLITLISYHMSREKELPPVQY